MDPAAASGQAATHQSPVLAFHAPTVEENSENGGEVRRMVGTWQVSYASAGTVYAEAFIQWHSDGTEWENIDFPVLSGNICLC